MLHPDHFYHIYNHANGNENLFRESRNYYFFLMKMKLYLSPYMKIYAYCLMPNHFHLLVSIRCESALKELAANSVYYRQLKEIDQSEYVYKKTSKSFANLCSSYTQSVNKVYQRKGSLFMPNFKSNPVDSDTSFCKLVHYIHANPVHHRFVSGMEMWPFSSFSAILSEKPTLLEREYVLRVFGNRDLLIRYHSQSIPAKAEWHDV